MDISEIIMHEDYNSSIVDQDFSLLKMARKVKFWDSYSTRNYTLKCKTISLPLSFSSTQIDWSANPNIRPVCLPSDGAGDYDQWISTVTGNKTQSMVNKEMVQTVFSSQCCRIFEFCFALIRMGNKLKWRRP